jgi:Rieske 2Fe-2S family protein
MLTERPAPTASPAAGWHPVVAETELPDPTTYVLADVGGQRAIVVRGRDGIVRAFHNVCKHRGTPVVEAACGTLTRIQCPYHSWVYDLEGALVRAKHTEDLDDFDFATRGLTPIETRIVDGVVELRSDWPAVPATGPLTSDEIAAVRRPYRAASLLPGRAYHDRAIFDFEREQWFGRDWVAVGRVDAVRAGGFVADVGGLPVHVSGGSDGLVAERADGRDRVRVEAWQGFVFVSLGSDRPPLGQWLGDLPGHLERFSFDSLRRGHRVVYDVAANWKLIAENYSECYHCPGVHPQLNRITPYDVGADYDTVGAWQGGWMALRPGFDTMALDGGHRIGPPMCGISPVDERRVDYLVVWPLLFLSVHPDYLLVHYLEPLEPGRTRIICDWLFEPSTMADPGFDASAAIEFWDVTNRQDWHVCELQQVGTASAGFRAGRFANNEPSVHAFDLMCVDRYEGSTFRSQREVRDRYDMPPPKLARA